MDKMKAEIIKHGTQEVRKIYIPEKSNHKGKLGVWVKLFWVCQVCGKPRGDIFKSQSFDGSHALSCHGWGNDCGHLDLYPAIRREASENGLNP